MDLPRFGFRTKCTVDDPYDLSSSAFLSLYVPPLSPHDLPRLPPLPRVRTSGKFYTQLHATCVVFCSWQSEYLTGFVDADGDDAGYGALDSGSEEEQVDAADHGTRKRTLDADADFKTHSAGSGLRKEGDTDDGLRDSTGDRRAFERTAEGVEGTCVILDPEHTEVGRLVGYLVGWMVG